MEKILTDFGVQTIYLAAQAVNFIILLLILKKFLYKPILKLLEERKQTVAATLVNSEKIEQQLITTEQESEKRLHAASTHAQSIIKNASSTAEEIIAEAHEKVKVDIDIMIAKGKQSIATEREAMKNELRKELAELVILGVERVAGKILDESDQKIILAQTIKKLADNPAAKSM